MYVIRFMGGAEANAYMCKEELTNNTQWQLLSKAKGFCFLPVANTSIEEIIIAYSWLEGNSAADSADCAIIFECDEHRLQKTTFVANITGRYDTRVVEYSTTHYCYDDLHAVELVHMTAQEIRNMRIKLFGSTNFLTEDMIRNDSLRYAGYEANWQYYEAAVWE